MLVNVKLPWQKDQESQQPTDAASTANNSSSAAGAAAAADAEKQNLPRGYTPPKGRPTPKRAQQEIARGVRRDPNGMSDAQRYQHRKELKKTMSKEEWKEYKKQEKVENRRIARENQAKMASGDERYLMARDRGPERAFVRDWVDSRRWLSEWAMPAALIMLVIMFTATFAPNFANITSTIAMFVIICFAIEGIYMGRKVNNAVRTKFKGTTAPGFGLGMYAFGRATQPRKWRTPRPRVERGAEVN